MEPATRVAEAIADDAVATTEYYGHVGRTTVGAALSRFSVGDMLVHREDIARTVGVGRRPHGRRTRPDRVRRRQLRGDAWDGRRLEARRRRAGGGRPGNRLGRTA
jgi:hypothetical protein